MACAFVEIQKNRIQITRCSFLIWTLLLALFSLLPNPASGVGDDLSSRGTDQSHPPEEKAPIAYDPFAGMEKDGRIPKKGLPDDIKNPGRWRYVPEGRIKPGNIIDRLFVSSFITPIVFYEQDV